MRRRRRRLQCATVDTTTAAGHWLHWASPLRSCPWLQPSHPPSRHLTAARPEVLASATTLKSTGHCWPPGSSFLGAPPSSPRSVTAAGGVLGWSRPPSVQRCRQHVAMFTALQGVVSATCQFMLCNVIAGVASSLSHSLVYSFVQPHQRLPKTQCCRGHSGGAAAALGR